ncbi:MAG: hypothetical protein QM541_17100 [Flavobacterium sp.]|nr:hypothetical protein [Flavobacterium sp.]
MTLKEFVFEETNHFVGMRRHTFFGKSVFLVLITKNFLIGLKLNKSLSIENTTTLFLQATPEKNTPRGAFSNPYSYLKEKCVRAVEKKCLFDQSIQAACSRNFRIDRIDIDNVHYEPVKISGFNYPHQGKIHIRYMKRSKPGKGIRTKHEESFTILGEQNASEIVKYILKPPTEELA